MAMDQEALDSLRLARSPQPVTVATSRRWQWIVTIAAFGVLAGASIYAARSDVVEVTAVRAAPSAGPAPVLDASGYVVARRQATVSSRVTGRVLEVLIEEGMEVDANALLARLDDSSVTPLHALALSQLDAARKSLTEVRVRLADAERNLERAQQLRAQQLVSQQQLDTAQTEAQALAAKLAALASEVKVAESNVLVRNQDLADLEVRAPFAGVVVSKDAQPGEIVSPISAGGGFTRTGIATIVDMSSREIEVDVNESFINRVREGQKTAAILDAYPDWSVPSRVINIVPTADRQKATVRVRIAFDVLETRILPDMGVKVRFLGAAEASTTGVSVSVARLPADAVVAEGDARYVWRVRDNTAERVAVRTGAKRDSQIDVLSGINVGDMIIVAPPTTLLDGTRIKLKADAEFDRTGARTGPLDL